MKRNKTLVDELFSGKGLELLREVLEEYINEECEKI